MSNAKNPHEKARNDYSVAIDAQTQQVDEEATRQLREQMAQNRGEEQRGCVRRVCIRC